MRVLFHRNFSRNFKKLPKTIRLAFKRRLKVFVEDPFHPLMNNHALSGEWRNFRSINVTGDMRALFHAIGEDAVEFVAIDTHGNLY